MTFQSARKLKDLEEKLAEAKQKKASLSEQVVQAQVGREETEKRSALLLELEKMKMQKLQLAKELEQYKSCDPQTLKELSEACWEWVTGLIFNYLCCSGR